MSEPKQETTGTITRIRVISAVIVEHGRLLLTQRKVDGPFAGAWCTPGGQQVPGETDAVTLGRELDEEIGVSVEMGELIEEVTLDPPAVSKPLIVAVYTARIVGEARPWGKEKQGIGWFEGALVSMMRLTPADTFVRGWLLEHLRRNGGGW